MQDVENYVRFMIRSDLPRVLEIERQCFDDPWGREHFLEVLSCRNSICRVVEREEQVVGFMVYDIHRTYYHLLNMAVAPSARGRGAANEMIETLKVMLGATRDRIICQVVDRNLATHLWLQRHDFVATHVLRNYYTPNLDAYVFEYTAKMPSPTFV